MCLSLEALSAGRSEEKKNKQSHSILGMCVLLPNIFAWTTLHFTWPDYGSSYVLVIVSAPVLTQRQTQLVHTIIAAFIQRPYRFQALNKTVQSSPIHVPGRWASTGKCTVTLRESMRRKSSQSTCYYMYLILNELVFEMNVF